MKWGIRARTQPAAKAQSMGASTLWDLVENTAFDPNHPGKWNGIKLFEIVF